MRWRAEDRRRMLAAAVDLALPTRAAQEGRRCSAMVWLLETVENRLRLYVPCSSAVANRVTE